MSKKKPKDLEIDEKILNKPENEQQAIVQKTKKNKKEKITIQVESAEKMPLFSMGNDSIEKSNLIFVNNTSNNNLDNLKISIDGEQEHNKKSKKGNAKTKTQTISQIIKDNQSSKILSTFSEHHFAMVFDGAKLLTPNVIFSALQYHKYDVFSYKKSWHIIISRELERLNALYLQGTGKPLPFFKDSVQVTILRSAPTLVDEDAVVIMFKYIIDALKRDKKNPYGVLADDNPKIIFKSESYNEKGPHSIGIRLDYVPQASKEQYTIDKILRTSDA